ncbi:type II toxin-antitoxin system RelE/ParE family toxin [Streptococcus tangpeifui]|uniref:type II toxin-antitoxin system RelE/ParE family toxin n=1 Tax=Streptococcus tangpeifui TaxID=2709400 RepID=UPI001F1537C1|nr:type II toxin-antitoxin system RelE/ParE family toxin [Streptococcus sp. ZJ373]
MTSKVYKIKYASQVATELRKVKAYVLEKSQSKDTSQRYVSQLVKGMEILKLFPEVGFNADKKFGRVITENMTTRGMPLKKDYIALYTIDDNNLVVNIIYLFSTKSDYMKLLKHN